MGLSMNKEGNTQSNTRGTEEEEEFKATQAWNCLVCSDLTGTQKKEEPQQQSPGVWILTFAASELNLHTESSQWPDPASHITKVNVTLARSFGNTGKKTFRQNKKPKSCQHSCKSKVRLNEFQKLISSVVKLI